MEEKEKFASRARGRDSWYYEGEVSAFRDVLMVLMNYEELADAQKSELEAKMSKQFWKGLGIGIIVTLILTNLFFYYG